MKVILLSPYCSALADIIKNQGDTVIRIDSHSELEGNGQIEGDFLLCYGYRHKIPDQIVSDYRKRSANLHTSFLPWNRGADPNLWSIVENTRKGVSIHEIDTGIDRGDIIVQREMNFFSARTLRETYQLLGDEILKFFEESWVYFRVGDWVSQNQSEDEGSVHYSSDRLKIWSYLDNGWDTTIKSVHKFVPKKYQVIGGCRNVHGSDDE